MEQLGPDPVDLFVGVRIRARRHELGLSQGALGERLGVSFQQVQKYERGTNRVSASMMVRAAKALGVQPAFFFEGLPDVTFDPAAPDCLKEWLASPAGQEWSRLGATLPDQAVRSLITVGRQIEQALVGEPSMDRAA